VIKTYQANTQLGFALPVWAVPAVPAAAVRTLPLMGGVSAGDVAGTKRRAADVAPVCGHTRITNGFVLDGAFPGTSAWSPPI